MTVLSANVLIKAREPRGLRDYTVTAAKTIYQGGLTFVIAATGLATDDGASGANQFVGVAKAKALTGEIVEVYSRGVFQLTTASAAAALIGDAAYSDDSDTTTATSTAARYIGTFTSFPATGEMEVEIDTQNTSQVDVTV